MAFEVESGTGSATANAYVSVADADTYHADNGDPSAWSAASTATKQAAIVEATRWLDAKFGNRWIGRQANEDQRLDWPRDAAITPEGFTYDDDEMPTALAEACAYMALKVVGGDTLLPDQTAPGNVKRELKSLPGPLTVETEYTGGGKSQIKSYPLVHGILRRIIRPGGTIERG